MTMADAHSLLRIFSDPIAMQYYPSTKNADQTRQWIKWTLANYRQQGCGLWIVLRRADGEFLGQCGVVPMDVNGTFAFEVGYLFVRALWGHGYATEAARACRDWGFRHLDTDSLISLPDSRNQPSIRVAQRVGMVFRERIVWHGKNTDVYGITRDQWAAVSESPWHPDRR
jgi:RimJ/RimL family protein N-acetyltransferase